MTQEKALDILKSGANVFLTGQAGAGKTYVLNQYISFLKQEGVTVAITASTGIAASHLGGLTIHSWSGMGIKDSINGRDLQKISSRSNVKKQVTNANVLIIDEISMLHKRQLDMVDVILKHIRSNQKAFGGMQVILCGDFFQLPPIGKRGETSKEKMAFMAEAWLGLNLNICYLHTQFRQKADELSNILNAIRDKAISEVHLNWLNQAADKQLEKATRLYTHNADVDNENAQRLSAVKGKKEIFKGRGKGNKTMLSNLKQALLCPEDLELKIGAEVMFVKNNFEKGFVNGTLGSITEIGDSGWPMVTCHDGNIVEAEPETWKVEDEEGKVLAQYEQIPLRLAYAITVHKSQGMTLDAAEIDLSQTFENGQGYVALSRLRNLKNLHLLGYNYKALEVDNLVAKADARFRQLSNEVELTNDSKVLKIKQQEFISRYGGKKTKEKKPIDSKKSTYDYTLDLIKQNKSLASIAKERDLTESTIVGHLKKIREGNPEINLQAYAPPELHISMVREAQAILEREGSNQQSQKLIYDILNKSLTYNDIKLALAFI